MNFQQSPRAVLDFHSTVVCVNDLLKRSQLLDIISIYFLILCQSDSSDGNLHICCIYYIMFYEQI